MIRAELYAGDGSRSLYRGLYRKCSQDRPLIPQEGIVCSEMEKKLLINIASDTNNMSRRHWLRNVDHNHDESNLQFKIVASGNKPVRNGTSKLQPQVGNFYYKSTHVVAPRKLIPRVGTQVKVEESRDFMHALQRTLEHVLSSTPGYRYSESTQEEPVDSFFSKATQGYGSDLDWASRARSITPSSFLKVLSQKDLARKLWQYLSVCSIAELEVYAIVCKASLPSLVVERHGMAIVYRISLRSKPFFETLRSYTISHFDQMVINEFGSRLTQHLLARCAEFAKITFSHFCSKWEEFMQRTPSAYFLTEYIRLRNEDNHGMETVRKLVFSNPSLMLTSKSYKKVLVCYLDYCSSGQLSSAYDLITRHRTLQSLLDDKHLLYIVRTLLARCHTRSVELLRTEIVHRLPQLFERKYFRYFLLSLRGVSLTSGIESVCQCVLQTALGEYANRLTLPDYCLLLWVGLAAEIEGSGVSLDRLRANVESRLGAFLSRPSLRSDEQC